MGRFGFNSSGLPELAELTCCPFQQTHSSARQMIPGDFHFWDFDIGKLLQSGMSLGEPVGGGVSPPTGRGPSVNRFGKLSKDENLRAKGGIASERTLRFSGCFYPIDVSLGALVKLPAMPDASQDSPVILVVQDVGLNSMSIHAQHLRNLLDSAAEIATMMGLWCVVACACLSQRSF